jgi:hypothetical protein
MLTLFACPKPFRGHIGVIQRNAIRSWTLLRPQPEIILFGDEEGIAPLAKEFDVRHVPKIARNDFGTPLLDDLFGQARELAAHEVLCYVNADIILLDDFLPALERVRAWSSRFLMVGRRTDVDINDSWNFSLPDGQARLRELALISGKQRPAEWIDYFAFNKDLAVGILPLAIGRLRWDNWLIWHARALHAPVVDATRVVLAIHQNHEYSHHPEGQAGIWQGEEARRNTALIGAWWRHNTTADATHVLAEAAIVSNLHHWVVKFKRAAHHITAPIWHPVLDFTRPLRQRLGLRKKSPSNSSVATQAPGNLAGMSPPIPTPAEKGSAPRG